MAARRSAGSLRPPVRSSKALATLMTRLANGTGSPSSRTWRYGVVCAST